MKRNKKERKKYRCEFMLNEEDYQKLLLVTGKYDSFTEIWEKALRGYYYKIFKTNELIDSKVNNEIIKEIIDSNISNINEAEELERLKALRKSKKVGASND